MIETKDNADSPWIFFIQSTNENIRTLIRYLLGAFQQKQMLLIRKALSEKEKAGMGSGKVTHPAFTHQKEKS